MVDLLCTINCVILHLKRSHKPASAHMHSTQDIWLMYINGMRMEVLSTLEELMLFTKLLEEET